MKIKVGQGYAKFAMNKRTVCPNRVLLVYRQDHVDTASELQQTKGLVTHWLDKEHHSRFALMDNHVYQMYLFIHDSSLLKRNGKYGCIFPNAHSFT